MQCRNANISPAVGPSAIFLELLANLRLVPLQGLGIYQDMWSQLSISPLFYLEVLSGLACETMKEVEKDILPELDRLDYNLISRSFVF